MDGSLPTGDTPGRHERIGAERVPKIQLKLPERAEALHPLQDRFVFFSPAIQYLYGGLNDQVLLNFLHIYNREVPFYHHRFRYPIFRGLEAYTGDPAWNSVLWAVEREHWEPLVDHFCAATLVNPYRELVYKYALQSLEVADPLYMQRAVIPSRVALLNVQAFGVKSNHWVAAFDIENAVPVLSPPKLRFYEPDPACKMYAQSLFTGENPEDTFHSDSKE